MNTTYLISLSVLMLIGAYFVTGCHPGESVPPLERSISELRSNDFAALRRAQAQIESRGQAALPRLVEVARLSTNAQQAALCCYLIGTIDQEAYKKALIELAVPGRLSTALRYPNLKAVESMLPQQRRELQAHFVEIAPRLTKEETACLENVIQAAKTQGN